MNMKRARCVDPLVEATSGHMAIMRTIGKNINALHRYWGHEEEEMKRKRTDWLEGNRSAFCTHVPKCLPVDDKYRPVDITMQRWKNIWSETRGGFNPEELPRHFQGSTMETYVEERGKIHIIGLFNHKLYPFLANKYGRRQMWEEIKNLKGAAIVTYQSSELRATRNNALDQMFEVFSLVIGTCFDVGTYSFFRSDLDGVKGAKYIPFDWMCSAMGDKSHVQDLLLMQYHGMKFKPMQQEQFNNYTKMKQQGISIQTRIPLTDGSATFEPTSGTKQRKKKGWVGTDDSGPAREEDRSTSPKGLRPSSAQRKRTGSRPGTPKSVSPANRTANASSSSAAKGKAKGRQGKEKGKGKGKKKGFTENPPNAHGGGMYGTALMSATADMLVTVNGQVTLMCGIMMTGGPTTGVIEVLNVYYLRILIIGHLYGGNRYCSQTEST